VAAKTKVKAPETEAIGLQDYELVLIFSPEIADDSAEAAIGKVSQFITDRGGTVASVDRWGKMRLAYPIKHFAEGGYVLFRFNLKPKATKELETNLKIAEEVLRHLLIRLGD
jgi:small subunit ribosomal protein S6